MYLNVFDTNLSLTSFQRVKIDVDVIFLKTSNYGMPFFKSL